MLDVLWAYVLFGLAMVPITVYFNQFLFFLFAFYVSMRKFYKKSDEPLEYLPGVSIVKPLMGLDPLLSENITSHLELQYPNFEVIFCVEDPNDPAIELVESLFRKYPNVDARLIIGGNGNMINPMVNNFLPGYESAKYDLVWVSTSRIKANTDIMVDMVRKSEDPRVALVHQLPFYSDQRGFMNAIEKVCFGCALGRSAIALNHMGMLCFTGMSYIVRKSILDRYGGFARFGKFLAEDYFCSKELFESGYKIVLSAYPAQQNVANASISIYVTRMVRWLRLRLSMLTIVAAFFEPMIECVNLGFLIALSLRYFFDIAMITTMTVHISLWILLDYFLLRCVQGGPLPFSFVAFIFAWWTRELLTYVIYVKAVLHPRTVKWGVNTYHLSLGGHTELLHSPNGGGGSAKRTKSVDLSPIAFHEAPPSEIGPLKTAAAATTPQEHIWRHFTQNGYIRGSADRQHLTLISDA
ncbi:Ceramide glucosyltransferase [Echinococcus granulosus]|nr:Ceramide glucosyltransferase [Echinococcus granulosus]CDS16344.1 ceramide glucosyltransferase [Echinococcus granulosus]